MEEQNAAVLFHPCSMHCSYHASVQVYSSSCDSGGLGGRSYIHPVSRGQGFQTASGRSDSSERFCGAARPHRRMKRSGFDIVCAAFSWCFPYLLLS
jgi:hypothetical protein